MTGAEIKAYIIRKFKRTDKDTELYEALTDVIADIRIQIRAEDFKEEAYVAGISTLGEYKLALPSDFGHIIGDITIVDTASNQQYGPIVKISKGEYDDKYGSRLLAAYSDMNSGVPQEYCIYAGQIFLGPVPDKTTYNYYINYTTEDYTEVDASTDPVPFSERYRNVLRAGVLAELQDGLQNYEEAGYWRALYVNGVSKIKSNDDDNIESVGQNMTYSGF
jgi:hypothetical protein